jgi:L-rhamnose mutarotase
MLTEPNYCSYCQGVDKIESGVGVKGNENKGLYIVRINGEVKANISAVNKKDADNQWQMLKTMVKGGRNPNYTISIEKKEEKIFDLSTTKGLQAAERYKAKLEKQYDEVTTSLIGNDKISIYAGR